MALGDFEYICTVKANGYIPVSKYKSKTTGLSVFLAAVDGPIVNGYFCLGKTFNSSLLSFPIYLQFYKFVFLIIFLCFPFVL